MVLWSMYDVGKAIGKVNGKLEAAEGGTEGVGSTFSFRPRLVVLLGLWVFASMVIADPRQSLRRWGVVTILASYIGIMFIPV